MDSIHEVGVLFEAALREVAAEMSTDDLAGLERRLQAVGRAVLGQVVERVLARRAACEGIERLPCPHCAGPMRRVDLARAAHPGCGGRLYYRAGLRPVRGVSAWTSAA